jgi:signal transduction histidine kinase
MDIGFEALDELPATDRDDQSDDGAKQKPRRQAFLATIAANATDRRLAAAVVVASAVAFVLAIPFAGVELATIPAFIPAYESALAINDLISAVLLFGLFAQLRNRALLALGSAYLFDVLLIVPHMLTFPGVFAPTGLLHAGLQTTGWLYIFWHGGFALLLLAYGLLGGLDEHQARPVARPGRAVALAVAGTVMAAILLTLAATVGNDYLPVLIANGNFHFLVTKGISPAIVAINLAALVVLWRKKEPAVLDLWIIVVLSAWLFDVALSAMIDSARYDLGWYVGRLYGLLAASFVLVVLLLETNSLHGRLAMANDALADEARNLDRRVRAATRDLAGANEALRREAAERQQAQANLVQAQKMEAIGNLTGGMAHDFNNLLGVIIGNLDMLNEVVKDEPDSAELAKDALDAALKGSDLTKRLLAFARRQPLQPEKINVNKHVGEMANLLTRTLGEQIQIKLTFAADTWPVVADPAQLESSLTNLATNARDAMAKGGSLTFTTANRILDEDYVSLYPDLKPGPYVLIEVSDTGSGMSPETVNRIFEPFFTTKETGKGTGLGLSMVFGFMKQSGGHINVYSELGAGTTFRLYLPSAAGTLDAARADLVDDAVLSDNETVLVVEDNERLRRVVVRQMRDLGYRVIETGNAPDALEALAREPIDLIFTDVVMPGGTSGYELAHTAMERWPDVKIVLTSGFPDIRLAGSDGLGNLRLLSKPYRKADLARTMREALGE